MKLFDSHCHLQSTDLLGSISDVIQRAAAAGVQWMVCCGTSAADWDFVLGLADGYPQIRAMLGVHPWFVNDVHPDDLLRLETHLKNNPHTGIGETGLDFQERFTNRSRQEDLFAEQLELARQLNRPVAVHCVRAWGRLVEILQEHPAPRVLLHAFGGPLELIPELCRLNCWFSFCGNVTNPQAKRVRAAAAAVPEQRLLLETDAPDFPPPGTPFPNEPVNLPAVCREISILRGTAPAVLASVTYRNAVDFFRF